MLRMLKIDLILIHNWTLGMFRHRTGASIWVIIFGYLLLIMALVSLLKMWCSPRVETLYGVPEWVARPVHRLILEGVYPF
jgi:hypothetical protein